MKAILLDTNGYRKLLEGKDEKVLQIMEKADKVFLSVIVLGELAAGFKGGSREQINKDILEKFLLKASVEILDVGRETAEVYGEVKNDLSKKGTPIPTNDLWIGSQAIETGSVLITYDRHFLKIAGLRVWDKLRGK